MARLKENKTKLKEYNAAYYQENKEKLKKARMKKTREAIDAALFEFKCEEIQRFEKSLGEIESKIEEVNSQIHRVENRIELKGSQLDSDILRLDQKVSQSNITVGSSPKSRIYLFASCFFLIFFATVSIVENAPVVSALGWSKPTLVLISMELMIVACFYVASVYGKVIFKNAAITMAVVVSTLVSIGSSFKFDSDLKEERLRLENLADKNPKIMGLKAMVENEQLLFNDLSETYNNPDSEKYHKKSYRELVDRSFRSLTGYQDKYEQSKKEFINEKLQSVNEDLELLFLILSTILRVSFAVMPGIIFHYMSKSLLGH